MHGNLITDKNVFQIFISEADDEGLPPLLASCTRSVASNSRGYCYTRLGGSALRSLIEQEYSSEVLAAYDKLVPFAYKADLGRYCLLHAFGGWYCDISVKVAVSLIVRDTVNAVIFRDAPNPGQPSWDISSSMIYARKGSRFLKLAIDLVVDNCRNEYYGLSSLCPTGPTVLGRALAIEGPSSKTVYGMYLPLTPYHRQKNYAFVLPSGGIVAFGKGTHGTPTGDGLQALGAKGTNSYNDLYRQRSIYRRRTESESV